MSGKKPRVIYSHQLDKRPRVKRKRVVFRKPDLTIDQVLIWADEFYKRTGDWPKQKSGRVSKSVDETWAAINIAFQRGTRGLQKDSLADLLARMRGVRNKGNLPPLTIEQILSWADAHYQRTGKWPKRNDGIITDAPTESWSAVNTNLIVGLRGLPVGSSLTRLLAKHRSVRNRSDLPPLKAKQILKWADEHNKITGQWPKRDSGPILSYPSECWSAIDTALMNATRGLSPESSLARFLSQHRGVRNQKELPSLCLDDIILWLKAFKSRTDQWPDRNSGMIPEAPLDSWASVDVALRVGLRGFPGGSSLARVLADYCGKPHKFDRPPLNEKTLLDWVDDHRKKTGKWPTKFSGTISASPDNTWGAVNMALINGLRGLPGGITLAQFLGIHRSIRTRSTLPPYTVPEILRWADDHYARFGRWPSCESGVIHAAPSESWTMVDHALKRGSRGLSEKSTLSKLLTIHRKS